MTCPVCQSPDVIHKVATSSFFNLDIDQCNFCGLSWVNRGDDQVSEVEEQKKFDHIFGTNRKRNEYYLEKLCAFSDVKTVLKVGSPKDFSFLLEIGRRYPFIHLFSYDLLHKDTPKNVEPISDITEYYSIIFCIHTLEHILPTDTQAVVAKMVNHCDYLFLEVPNCHSIDRLCESSKHPHNVFFTKKSLTNLLGTDSICRTTNHVIQIERKNV